MKALTMRFTDMSQARMLQVWFGILGIAAGATVMLSGMFTSGKTEASNNEGITITVVRPLPSAPAR